MFKWLRRFATGSINPAYSEYSPIILDGDDVAFQVRYHLKTREAQIKPLDDDLIDVESLFMTPDALVAMNQFYNKIFSGDVDCDAVPKV